MRQMLDRIEVPIRSTCGSLFIGGTLLCAVLIGCSRPEIIPPSPNFATAVSEVRAWVAVGTSKSDVPAIVQRHGFVPDERAMGDPEFGTNHLTVLNYRYRHGFILSGTDLRLTIYFDQDRVSAVGLRADPFGFGH